MKIVARKQSDRIGRFFTYGKIDNFWAVFLEITEVAQIIGPLFPRYNLCFNLDQKMGWASFWAIFFTNSSGPNPTTSFYNARVVNFYNATGSLGRFESSTFLF
jgi:hypothetical protein